MRQENYKTSRKTKEGKSKKALYNRASAKKETRKAYFDYQNYK